MGYLSYMKDQICTNDQHLFASNVLSFLLFDEAFKNLEFHNTSF